MTSKPWHVQIAEQLGSHHSDTMAVVRDSRNPKRRTLRRRRRAERDELRDWNGSRRERSDR